MVQPGNWFRYPHSNNTPDNGFVYFDQSKDINQYFAEFFYKMWKESRAHYLWMMSPNVKAIGLGIGELQPTGIKNTNSVRAALALWGDTDNSWDDPISRELHQVLKEKYGD